MELIVKNTSVHGETCIGCQRHEQDVMIGFMSEKAKDSNDRIDGVNDLFMTREQAETLLTQLMNVLAPDSKSGKEEQSVLAKDNACSVGDLDMLENCTPDEPKDNWEATRVKYAMLIEFPSEREIKKAIDAGKCEFTLFGGDE